MALFDSRNSKFFIEDAGGTERDLSAYLTEISGLPGSRVLDEVTSLADSGRRFIPGRQEGIITIRGVFDNTVSSGPDAVLGPLLSHSAPWASATFRTGTLQPAQDTAASAGSRATTSPHHSTTGS